MANVWRPILYVGAGLPRPGLQHNPLQMQVQDLPCPVASTIHNFFYPVCGHSQKGYTRFAAPTCNIAATILPPAGLLVGECTGSGCRWTQSSGACHA